MRIAVLGDTHLGRSLYSYDLTPNIRRLLYDFFRLCVRYEVDAAVHLGDVGDKPVWPIEQQKIVVQWCNEFERAGLPLYLMVGNHDVVSRRGSVSALDYLRATRFRYVRVVDRPFRTPTNRDDTDLLFLPFPSPGLYEDDEQWMSDVGVVCDSIRIEAIAFSHLNVRGAVMGEQEWMYRGDAHNIPERVLNSPRIRAVFNGHIHKRQVVGRVVHPGAAERLNFGECSDSRAICIVDTSDYSVVSERLVNASRLKQIELDVSAWSRGGSDPPSTDEILGTLSSMSVSRQIVKVQPFVDDQSTVDWKTVESHLYKRGALHVALAPPVRVKQEHEQKKQAEATEPPLDSARRFIRSRVQEKKERIELTKLFKQMQAEHDHRDTG